MKDETVAAEFTADLRNFLEQRGYSHIHSLGIEPKEVNDANEPETGKENYWLEPIKEDIERTKRDTEKIIQKINDAGVLEMAEGENVIQFMIKVPQADYEDYLKLTAVSFH